MDEKKKHTTPEERIELWADLIKDVSPLLPVKTKREFICLCIDASDGYKDEYENTFFISEKYASSRWKYICNEAACGRDGVFVKYVRERDTSGFVGQWQKVNKQDYISTMQNEANGIATRVENYNYSVEIAKNRWKNINLPGFERLPELTAGV